jgi:hypothetical protein
LIYSACQSHLILSAQPVLFFFCEADLSHMFCIPATTMTAKSLRIFGYKDIWDISLVAFLQQRRVSSAPQGRNGVMA